VLIDVEDRKCSNIKTVMNVERHCMRNVKGAGFTSCDDVLTVLMATILKHFMVVSSAVSLS
jgi:hypothetical protein